MSGVPFLFPDGNALAECHITVAGVGTPSPAQRQMRIPKEMLERW
jgi:hypothetical protein